jgi:NitT/TauT family transport system ATP-binding protein
MNNAPKPIIEFRGVAMAFESGSEDFFAIKGIDVSIGSGRFIALLGPSGCGKTTLLNLTAGLMVPTFGEVLYEGRPISGVNHEVGYITQKDSLLPWRRVSDNVGIALQVRGMPRNERTMRIAEMLEQVGLSGFGNRYPSQLSGGMKKRVTLARTLIYNPSTLLMDEPFGALDAQLRAIMQRDLLKLWERDKKTVLFVTHDVEEAVLLADHVLIFGRNPGRIIEHYEVELERPREIDTLRSSPIFISILEHLRGSLSEFSAPMDKY